VARLHAYFRRRLESWVLRHADAIVCTSPSLAAMLRKRFPTRAAAIHCIPNGFDDPPVQPVATGQRLNIVFGGALYANRDPFPFLDALSLLLADPGVDASRVRVVLVGECDSYKGVDVRGWLTGKTAGKVTQIFPKVGAEELKSFYADATVLLNLAQGQPMQIPAKTFEQLASGRELLLLCESDSDTGRIVNGIPGVHRVDGNDVEAIRAVLRDLYERHVVHGSTLAPRPEQITQFSRLEQNRRLVELFREMAGRRAASVD
jgi:glycosyltransferase involved in cell wall biosynthesis